MKSFLKITNTFFSLFFQGLLYGYKYILSPFLGNNCRFSPSCSVYMYQMIRQKGPWLGLQLGMRQLLKCHPWSKV